MLGATGDSPDPLFTPEWLPKWSLEFGVWSLELARPEG
jgi:hypothetical protein